MRIPEIIAHRGHTLHYPENTLAGVEDAIRAGVRYVEIDVQLSADGVPVLFHDRSLERLCGVAGAIHERTLEELRALRAADEARFGESYVDEPIATLEAFSRSIARHPQVTAFVEIKRIAIERFGAEEVLQAVLRDLGRIRERCVLISFSFGFLQHVRRTAASLPIAVVVDRYAELADPDVLALAPEYAFCGLHGLPETGTLRAPGSARLVIYEVADGPLALQLAERGVDMIETFACAEMLRFFALSASK